MDLEGGLLWMDAFTATTNSRATTPQQAYDAVYKRPQLVDQVGCITENGS